MWGHEEDELRAENDRAVRAPRQISLKAPGATRILQRISAT